MAQEEVLKDKPYLIKASRIVASDLEKTIKIDSEYVRTKFGEWRFATACMNDGFGCCGAYCKDDD